MKNILFFSCEPGGAETLVPVIRLLQARGIYDVTVLGYGFGLDCFNQHGIFCTEIEKIREDDAGIVSMYMPDLIITSATSLPTRDMSEKLLWQHAKKMGVKTLAFIDQWQNYSLRFSGVDARDRLKYLPDHINCINEIGRREMIREGFPEDRLIAFGHPYLSDILERYAALDADAVVSALEIASSDIRREETLIFVSEPLLENFGNSRGYNQYDVLDYFLKNVLLLQKRTRVIIKLHPKDDLDKFRNVLEKYREIDIHIVQNRLSSLECLTLSDRIFGMTSIMLIEAFLLGKVVVSLQPGLMVEDPLILSRQGLIPRINDFINFDPFVFERPDPSKFPVDFDKLAFLEFIKRNTGLVSFPSVPDDRSL